MAETVCPAGGRRRRNRARTHIGLIRRVAAPTSGGKTHLASGRIAAVECVQRRGARPSCVRVMAAHSWSWRSVDSSWSDVLSGP